MNEQTAPGWYPDPGGAPMRRWFDGEQWADRWEPVETEAQKVTADGVKAMTVVVIAIAGVLAFAVVWWVLQAMVEAQRF